MDKIAKLLKKLSPRERDVVEQAIVDILTNNLATYDQKKLRGHANLYRIRVSQIRIVFVKSKDDAQILLIERRNENTYKDF
jgi:mRNA-degrading endonuclease RelE of RelBE toxin-antitoxin system